MTGYMIYEKNDAQKNKMYVEMHKEAFADFGVDIKLVLTDKIYKEHKMELGKPEFCNKQKQGLYNFKRV